MATIFPCNIYYVTTDDSFFHGCDHENCLTLNITFTFAILLLLVFEKLSSNTPEQAGVLPHNWRLLNEDSKKFHLLSQSLLITKLLIAPN